MAHSTIRGQRGMYSQPRPQLPFARGSGATISWVMWSSRRVKSARNQMAVRLDIYIEYLFRLLVRAIRLVRCYRSYRAGGSASGFLAACLKPVTSKSRSRSERTPISQLAFAAEDAESVSAGFSICFSSNCFLSGIAVLLFENIPRVPAACASMIRPNCRWITH